MYKTNIINIIIILCLCAAIFTSAVPLDMTSRTSSLDSRSAKPLNYNAGWAIESIYKAKKRGILPPTLVQPESDINESSVKNRRLMTKRIIAAPEDAVLHAKRAKKQGRRSVVKKQFVDKDSKRNEK
ncbi:3046_t:CDS:2 [Funneliformis mosseae]|uniref:3046_t:CDS:1 n=1 Tax=Funneliformis mosseae TaxID=27381 RepID=A0A9N9C882_FUNMO|nr:3046_t:CDS:2 [Funneliformis mosseae]